MSPEYTPQIGDELIQYIRNYKGVVACGRFNNNKMILNGELVKTLVIEKILLIWVICCWIAIICKV